MFRCFGRVCVWVLLSCLGVLVLPETHEPTTRRTSLPRDARAYPETHEPTPRLSARPRSAFHAHCVLELRDCRIVENSSVSAIVFHEQCKDSVSRAVQRQCFTSSAKTVFHEQCKDSVSRAVQRQCFTSSAKTVFHEQYFTSSANTVFHEQYLSSSNSMLQS